MPKMVYINIPYNDFTGTIPSTWNTTTLKHLNLGMNELSGSIPAELTGIESLDNLFLTGNNLRGFVPSSVCVTDTTNVTNNVTYNGMNMMVDCESVSCSCCGCNGVTPPPSALVADDEIDARVDSTNATENTTSIEESETTVPETVVDITPTDSTVTNEETSAPVNAIVDETASDVPEIVVDSASTMTPIINEGIPPAGNDVVDDTNGDVIDSSIPASTTTNVGSTSSIPVAGGFTPEEELEAYPYIDNATFDEAISVLNGALPKGLASEPYGCQSIEIGFSCYTSGWSIDFELSNSACANEESSTPPATEDYDLVGIFPFEGEVRGPEKLPTSTSIGTLKSLSDAIFWATACGLAECDGVIANGEVYYRNTYPAKTDPLSPSWWPLEEGSMMQLQWIRVDSSGTAIVIAESRPFSVDKKCK